MEIDIKQMGEAPIVQLLLKFSVPAFIGMAVEASYMTIDSIFIGHGVGSIGIAAITATLPVMIAMMAFANLIGIGSGTTVSLLLGEEKKEQAEVVLGNTFVLLILMSSVPTLIGLFFLDPLLGFLGANTDLLPFSHEYLHIILFGSVFMFIGGGLNNLIGTEGNPGIALKTALVGVSINIVLCPLFIFYFGWGLSGAAWATFIAEAASAAWILSYFIHSKKSVMKLRQQNFCLKSPVLKKIISIGMPSIVMEAMAVIVMTVVNINVVLYSGNMALAAFGIINSIGMVIVMPVFAISQGALPIFGYNYGAKKFDRIYEILKISLIAGTIFVTCVFFIIEGFAEYLIPIYTNDPEVIKFGANAIRIFMLMLPLEAVTIITGGYFQATGRPKQAIAFMLFHELLFIGLIAFVLPPHYGINGIIYAAPIADFLGAIVLMIGLCHDLRQQKREYLEPGVVI
jgi:putative MATE family efflux protein